MAASSVDEVGNSSSKPLSVVLLSGGMDSCVTLAQAIADGTEPAALHVNYGQRTQDRELRAFNEICDHYRIERRLVVDISHLAQIGGSALTDTTISVPQADPQADPQAIDHTATKPPSTVPVTYVPFRNANILAIATSWAEVLHAESVYIGAVEEDSSGYPDCRDAFFRAFQQVIETGTDTGKHIQIRTPVITLSKKEIVELGSQLEAPLHLTWSCYQAQDLACGVCDSCTLRLRGFAAARMVDPIAYAQ
ncbi:MAG: 7-cyano-7-deazaguanine synthase QueC [Bradyrhizobiaceae bacterium]|nr:7-cyano-7-deazaguanine synthase QueC [Bradyrhizobiaceae bacterium]